MDQDEKVFEYFLEMDPKNRLMVIDSMQPDDRCRFTRCSKQSDSEVKSSKNYVHSLSIFCSPIFTTIRVVHGTIDNRPYGFMLNFLKEERNNVIVYTSFINERNLLIDLDSSKELIQCAVEEFRRRMKIYQVSLKKLQIEGHVLTNFDLGIGNLPNLKELKVHGDFDILQFLSKLSQPLEKLIIMKEANSELLKNCEQIYQVKQYLEWRNANFDYQQVQRLTTKNLVTSIGKLTEFDLFKIIRTWQDGTIGKEIETFRFLNISNFNKIKILRFLRISDDQTTRFEIKHYHKAGKSAQLWLAADFIRFDSL